jgi:hypothetical protein
MFGNLIKTFFYKYKHILRDIRAIAIANAVLPVPGFP